METGVRIEIASHLASLANSLIQAATSTEGEMAIRSAFETSWNGFLEKAAHHLPFPHTSLALPQGIPQVSREPEKLLYMEVPDHTAALDTRKRWLAHDLLLGPESKRKKITNEWSETVKAEETPLLMTKMPQEITKSPIQAILVEEANVPPIQQMSRTSNMAATTPHRRADHTEKPYQCSMSGCEAAFARKDILATHVRTHTGEKPYKCSVTGCDAAFTQMGHRTVHLRTHTGEKPYKCPLNGCNAAFADKSNLKRHFKTHTNKLKTNIR